MQYLTLAVESRQQVIPKTTSFLHIILKILGPCCIVEATDTVYIHLKYMSVSFSSTENIMGIIATGLLHKLSLVARVTFLTYLVQRDYKNPKTTP